jgi:hypothetical protein
VGNFEVLEAGMKLEVRESHYPVQGFEKVIEGVVLKVTA